MKIKFNEKWDKIKSFFKFNAKSEAETEETVDAEATIDNLQIELTAREQTINQLTDEIDALTTSSAQVQSGLSETQALLEKANARITELETENSQLRKGPGASTTTAISETESGAAAEADDDDVKFCATHTAAENVAYLKEKYNKK